MLAYRLKFFVLQTTRNEANLILSHYLTQFLQYKVLLRNPFYTEISRNIVCPKVNLQLPNYLETLLSAKPLPEPMMTYWRFDPKEQISVIFFIEIQIVLEKKMHSCGLIAQLQVGNFGNNWYMVFSTKAWFAHIGVYQNTKSTISSCLKQNIERIPLPT